MVEINVAKVFKHASFNKTGTVDNDICVMRLEKLLKFTGDLKEKNMVLFFSCINNLKFTSSNLKQAIT